MWEALILGILESSLIQISCSCSIIRKRRPDGFAQGNPRHLFVSLKSHLTVLFPVPWSAYLPLSSFLHPANYVSTLIYAEQRGKWPFKGYPLSFFPISHFTPAFILDRDGRENINFKRTMGGFFMEIVQKQAGLDEGYSNHVDSHLPFKLAFCSEVER